ncbi:MAG: hypothetical protein JOZ73_11975 [Solirubrobacterales bacterium]|nr:hypothetical protein [Solirubrobacterales bacterium]
MADSTGKARMVALAVTTTAGVIDLAANMPISPATDPRETAPFGHYISLVAEGGDVYVLFGPTNASVTGANVPNPATTGSAQAGTVGLCQYIPAGRELPIHLPRGPGREGPLSNAPALGGASPMRFLAYVTKSGTATLRIHQSSP